MRSGTAAAVVWAAIAVGAGVAEGKEPAEEVPAPRFDRVEYAKPGTCLALDRKAGDERAIRIIAAGLKKKTPEETLEAIDRWIAKTLEWDPETFDSWRTVDRMIEDGTYGGCADHAMVYGTLLRACGIPTVWVKTMDLSWIEKFRTGAFDPSKDTWSGHVLLEVHLGGEWRLLDAQGRTLYMRYDPEARLFPDGRFAYDKGVGSGNSGSTNSGNSDPGHKVLSAPRVKTHAVAEAAPMVVPRRDDRRHEAARGAGPAKRGAVQPSDRAAHRAGQVERASNRKGGARGRSR